MDKFLVDSDVVIWYLKGREKEAMLLENLSKKGDLFLSVVTITEVRTGLTKSPGKVIRELKDIFQPLEITSEIAELGGAYKQKYRLDIADMLIAATVHTHDLILVTYNKKHFPMEDIKPYEF